MTTLVDKVRLFSQSSLFDETWYVGRYPDVLRCGMSPAAHYVRIGRHIGREPKQGHDAHEASRFIAACRTVNMSEKTIGADLRNQVAALRLFDEAWYRTHMAPNLPESADALADYLARSASDPLIDPSPIFSTCHYVEKNPAIGDVAPLLHACSHGMTEGRPAFDPIKVDEFLSSADDIAHISIDHMLDKSHNIYIVYWDNGNFFFKEIAEYLSGFLRNSGYDADCGPDTPHSDLEHSDIIVVAPHEYCVHGPGKDWEPEQFARAIYLNTEQWHTPWFSLAYRFMMLSKKAIDINPASTSGLRRLGIHATFLPILPLKGTPFHIDRTPLSQDFATARYIPELTYPETLTQRPYDVLFVGAANARREAALASLASVLADQDTFIHCPRFHGPVRPGDPDMMSTSDLVQVARHSKILLNIHQGESRYFEWHRLFLFGIMEGCVVLTEPCIPNTFVQTGEHFLECELEEMPERLRWLLETTEGQAEMRRIHINCNRLRQSGNAWGTLGI